MKKRNLALARLWAATFILPAAAPAQTNTLTSYTSTGGTNFAAPVLPNAWSGGNPGLGGATADIRLLWMPNGFGHTINNDAVGVFDVNTLRLQSLTSGSTSLGTSGSSTFNFTGTDPKIVIEGWGSFLGATSSTSFSPSNISTATADLRITGTAHGDVTFNGLSGTSKLLMNASSGLINSQIFNYSVASNGGANTATVVLNSGNLRLGPSTTLSIGLGGVAAIEANGGRLNINSSGTTTGPAFMTASMLLNSTLVQTGGSISTAALTGFANTNSAGQYLAYTLPLTGAGGFTLSPTMGGSTTALRATNSYAGSTTLAFPAVYGTTGLALPGSVTLAAVLTIDGINGGTAAQLAGTSSVNVKDGNLLVVNNGAASADRIRDAAPISFQGAGGAFFNTGTGVAYSETMGDLSLPSGTATLTVGNAGGTTTINGSNIGLTFASLTRAAGEGMLFIRGGASGATATTNGLGTGATTARVLFTAAPATSLYAGAPNIGGGASPSVAILPNIIGGAIASETGATTTNASSFTFGLTTSGTNGVRLLSATEYDLVTASGTTVTLGSGYGNLRLNQSAASTHNIAAGGTTLNSLFINPASGVVTLGAAAGTDPILFPADAANLILINQGQSTTVNAPVTFGGEGRIYAANNSSQTSGPNFNGGISGSNGLTIAGPGGVNLTALNTVSGQLTLDGARVGITSADNLKNITTIAAGGSASSATTGTGNGTTPTATRPRLQYNGAALSSILLPQAVVLKSGLLEVINTQTSGSSNNTTIELSGAISGEGGFFVNLSQGGVSGSVLKLSGTGSTYSGQTRVQGGTLAITGDAVLGNSPTLDLSSTATIGALRLDGDWTTSRQINFSSSGSINTNGFNAVLNGPVSSSGAATTDTFTKLGAGTLTLAADSPAYMGLRVSGGRLNVNTTVGTSGTVTIDSGATLGGNGTILKGITTSAGGTLAPGTSPGTLTVGGSLTFNASGSVYSNLEVEIATLSSYDVLRLTGTGTNFTMGSNPSLSGTATSNVLLNASAGPGSGLQIGDTLWIVRNDAPVSGTSSGSLFGVFRNATGLLADDSLGNLVDLGNGFTAAISYNADFDTLNGRFADSVTLGNDIALSIVTVPEPSVLLISALAGVGFAWRRRREG